MGYVLLRTIVVAFCSFWYFQTACFTAAAEVGFAGRVNNLHAIYIQKIVVESYYQRIAHAVPVAIQILFHLILLAADVEDYFLCLRSMELYISSAVLIYTRIVAVWNDSLQGEHHVCIALAHGAVAFCDEVETVATLWTAL